MSCKTPARDLPEPRAFRRWMASVWISALFLAPVGLPGADSARGAPGAVSPSMVHAGPIDDTLDYLFDLLEWLLGESDKKDE